MTISNGALSIGLGFNNNLRNSADQASYPYASIGLTVLSNILRGKVCDIVIPVYSTLHNENMPFLDCSFSLTVCQLN